MKDLGELLDMPPAEYAAWVQRLRDDKAALLLTDWPWWRRGDQCPPAGDWHVWMLLAGRGFGKTRTGAEWIRGYAETHPGARIALVAASLHEGRQVMIEGESGLLAIAPDDDRPDYESSLRRLSWANGAVATLYSAAEPESLRGPEHSAAWCDEIAKWPQGEAAWDNLMLTMRIGEKPRVVATTTPRGVPLVRRLIDEKGVEKTGGSTRNNRHNLSPQWLATMDRLYGGTRLGRQELGGELLEDVEGALWTRALVERCRVEADAVGKSVRVVIGVDPPATVNGDACGIEDLKRLALSVMADIARAAIANGIGAVGGGSGGGGLLSLGASIAAALFGAPGRATGGPVSAGRAYRVGERGPELFVPTASGRIEAAGGGVRKIAITVNVRGEAGSEPQRLAQTGRQLARAVRRAVAAGED